jgi:hypothetical protein
MKPFTKALVAASITGVSVFGVALLAIFHCLPPRTQTLMTGGLCARSELAMEPKPKSTIKCPQSPAGSITWSYPGPEPLVSFATL